MAEPRKYTRQTTSTYPDPTSSTGQGIQVTAWTEDAWNRAQEANRRYQADQEWQRAHPYLARARSFMGKAGDFINDEILLNRGNVRVKNAQANPKGLKWFREGGNEAVALLGLGTSPMWLPEVAAALPTLSGAGKGSLLSTAIPQITSRTAPQAANLLNWSALGLGTYTLGRILGDNPPTFSTPSFSLPQFGSRTMSTAATAPTDSIGSAPAPAPTDSIGTPQPAPAPAQPTTGSTAGSGSTASPAPASPEPERNDSTNNKGFLRRMLGLESRPFSGKGNIGKYGRDALRIGGFWAPAGTAAGAFGIDMMGNIVGAAQEPDSVTHEMTFPLTRKRFTPERGVLRLLGGYYQTRPAQPSTPADTTRTNQPAAVPVAPTDTVPGQAQPDSTSYNSFDAELDALRKAYGGN